MGAAKEPGQGLCEKEIAISPFGIEGVERRIGGPGGKPSRRKRRSDAVAIFTSKSRNKKSRVSRKS